MAFWTCDLFNKITVTDIDNIYDYHWPTANLTAALRTAVLLTNLLRQATCVFLHVSLIVVVYVIVILTIYFYDCHKGFHFL